MADGTYDAVVIGGGHHGTIVACYLAKAGLKIAVLERHTAFGGGAISEEGPAPGFRQNPCAHFTRFYGHPAYEDFKLREEGLEYVFPEQNEGMIFDDGSSFIGYSAYRVVDPVTGRAELRRTMSRKHSSRSRRSRSRTRTRIFGCSISTKNIGRPPSTSTGLSRRRRGLRPTRWKSYGDSGSGIEPVHQFMSIRQMAYDYFESPELRTLFMRATPTSGGGSPTTRAVSRRSFTSWGWCSHSSRRRSSRAARSPSPTPGVGRQEDGRAVLHRA